VFDAAAYSGLRPVDDRRGIRNPTAARAALEAWIPGALAVSLRTQAVARFGGREAGVAVVGIEPAAEAAVSTVARDFVAGSLAGLAGGGDNVAIGRRLAETLGARLGDSVDLIAASGQARSFRIVGMFHTGVGARDEGEAYVLLKNAQVLAGRPDAINEIRIRLEDPNAARAVAARVEAQLGYKAVSWQESNEALMEVLFIRNVIMYTVVGAILLVAGFGVFNIVSTITHEKARDIAILKSLGFREADMRRLFLAEGVAIGVAGSAMGALLGLGLCAALAAVRFDFEGPAGAVSGLPLTRSPAHYAIAAAVAIGAAAAAGWLPARRAARLNPVDIIRGAA
jgi:lipoprotein-releasing system permease protein